MHHTSGPDKMRLRLTRVLRYQTAVQIVVRLPCGSAVEEGDRAATAGERLVVADIHVGGRSDFYQAILTGTSALFTDRVPLQEHIRAVLYY